jgi:hypothetical protein
MAVLNCLDSSSKPRGHPHRKSVLRGPAQDSLHGSLRNA